MFAYCRWICLCFCVFTSWLACFEKELVHDAEIPLRDLEGAWERPKHLACGYRLEGERIERPLETANGFDSYEPMLSAECEPGG